MEVFAGKQALTQVMSNPQDIWYLTQGVWVYMVAVAVLWIITVSHSAIVVIHWLRHDAGYRCASYDKDFHPMAMNFNTAAGWLHPFCTWGFEWINIHAYQLHDFSHNYITLQVCSVDALRLVLWVVLHMPVDSLGHLAPDCSSWGIPSRGTSLRNFVNVAGNVFLPWVQGANQMVSRNLGIAYSEIDRYLYSPHGGPTKTVMNPCLGLPFEANLGDSTHVIPQSVLDSGAAPRFTTLPSQTIWVALQPCFFRA